MTFVNVSKGNLHLLRADKPGGLNEFERLSDAFATLVAESVTLSSLELLVTIVLMYVFLSISNRAGSRYFNVESPMRTFSKVSVRSARYFTVLLIGADS